MLEVEWTFFCYGRHFCKLVVILATLNATMGEHDVSLRTKGERTGDAHGKIHTGKETVRDIPDIVHHRP